MRRRRSIGGGFSPRKLFANGVAGAWYDPSDFSTLFQDTSGTTPVTAVEQSIALMRDKSGNNNHVSQATSGSQPVLRARYNLLTYSEQFDNANWVPVSSSITADQETAPDGTVSADLFYPTATGNNSRIYQAVTVTTSQVFSVYAKAAGINFLNFRIPNNSAAASVYFNLSNGTVSSGTGTITSVGNGWYRCSASVASSGSAISFAPCDASGSTTVTANGTNGIYIWGADLRTGSSAGTYQRIAAATDYATAGFAPYLAFDGTADFLGASYVQSAYPLTLAAGINNAAGAANSGIVSIAQSDSAYKQIRDDGNNITTSQDRNAGNFAPTSIFVSGGNKFCLAQFETSLVTHQVNSGAATTIANTNAFGTSANIFVGKTRPAGLFATARIYGIVITNSVLSESQISSLRSWMGGKMGVSL